jgi:hypothetical protein
MKKVLTIVIAVVALQLVLVSASYAQGNTYHKVRYGETLFSIGRTYNVHPYHIAQVNGLHNPNIIYAGQVLYIPSGSSYPWPCGGGNNCGGWDNCGGGGCGWQHSNWRDGCGNNCGWQDSNWQQGCGNNCGWQDSNWRHDGCGNNCGWQDSNWQQGCGNNCGWQGSGWGNKCGQNDCYDSYYGYDYTGYYYGNQHKRYSHTCGYYSNCW